MRRELEDSVLTRDLYPTALGYYPEAKQHSMHRVEHDDYLLMYCVGGEGELWQDEHHFNVAAGDLLILPPKMAHYYAAKTDDPWSVYWVHFRGSHSESYFAHLGLSYHSFVLRSLCDITLQAELKSLVETAEGAYGLGAWVHCSSKLRLFMTHIERLAAERDRDDQQVPVERVTEYMKENIGEHLSLEQLASVARLSKFYFARKYKSITGFAPLQHFAQLKIDQACLLFDSTNLTISEVAYQLGFDDPLYFSRVFRKFVGIPPGKYRRRFQSQS